MQREIKKYLSKKALKMLFAYLERFLASNWFNPFATIYLNFRCFPLSQAFLLPVWMYGRPVICTLYGKMQCSNKIHSGMIRINVSRLGAPSCMSSKTELNIWGKIIFHGKSTIGTGNKINIGIQGSLELGNSVLITDYVNIAVYKKVVIGDFTEITHRCQIFDTNFHYVANLNKNQIPYFSKSIIIGKYCWICNTSTITGGGIIPDYTIVASHSLINKSFSEIPLRSLIGGVPAKLITSGVARLYNRRLEKEVCDFYISNSNADCFIFLGEPEELLFDQ